MIDCCTTPGCGWRTPAVQTRSKQNKGGRIPLGDQCTNHGFAWTNHGLTGTRHRMAGPKRGSGLPLPVAGRFARHLFNKPAEISGVGEAEAEGNRFYGLAAVQKLAYAFVGHPRFDEQLWAFL